MTFFIFFSILASVNRAGTSQPYLISGYASASSLEPAVDASSSAGLPVSSVTAVTLYNSSPPIPPSMANGSSIPSATSSASALPASSGTAVTLYNSSPPIPPSIANGSSMSSAASSASFLPASSGTAVTLFNSSP